MIAWSVSWASSMIHLDSLGPPEDVPAESTRRGSTSGRGVVVEPLRHRRRVLDQVGYVVGEEVDGGDEEVAAAHRRVEDLEIEDGLGRIERDQLGVPVRAWAGCCRS